jgi:predicted ester cyclase
VTDRDANKLRSRRLYEQVFGGGNYAAADELLAPDHLSHGPGVPAQSGVEHIKRQAALLRTALPDLVVQLEDQVAEGERVSSRWRGTGIHAGPLQLPSGAVAPTGNRVDFQEIRIDRHVGGRIVESWFIPDRMTLWQQLGLLPPR